MVDAGLTPLQALRSATSDAARFLGRKDLGVIEPGALADLVLLDADPLSDIPQHLRDPRRDLRRTSADTHRPRRPSRRRRITSGAPGRTKAERITPIPKSPS
ncbi:MAG TPA: amidohydrolase family protein [Thermoanaerobaculia bacterium]|nr:amidohydrolase family protein [Thermoanaerobaculia bacterium]